MRGLPGDLVGICDSFQHAHHLQSFFVLCHGPLLKSGEFTRALRNYNFPVAKRDVVQFGELLLSSEAVTVGGRLIALCPYEDLAAAWLIGLPRKIAREKGLLLSLGMSSDAAHQLVEQHFLSVLTSLQRGEPLNPSHVFWEEMLLHDVGVVKRELLLSNPADVPDYYSLCQACVRRKVLMPEELRTYLSRESKPSLTPEFLRLMSDIGPLADPDTPSIDYVGMAVGVSSGRPRDFLRHG
jgi:hypothetical protein